jgi:serine/threonine protein kinase
MFHAGQQFGFYTLIRPLGRGGFGEVWLAERRTRYVTTQVAVKLPLDEQVDHAAIEKEAQLWAQASGHANVLPIIEANEYDGQILIVSEYAVDGSLEDLLRSNSGALPVQQAVEMTIGILKGLEFLHSRKIIHRDIKPANILLQGDTPRLADFGISRVLKTTSLATSVVGTPYYMAPEAFKRKRNAQTDVWSVGVLLYQMLKGKRPFSGDNIPDLFGAIMMDEPEPLPDVIPVRLRKVVWKALSKDAAGRYQTAREMRDELDECWRRLSPPVAAQTEEPAIIPEKPAVAHEEPAVIQKVDDKPTIIIPAPSPEINERHGEIEEPTGPPDNPPVLPPAPPKIKGKSARFFINLAMVLLLVGIIAVGYWLLPRGHGSTANNPANTSPVTSPSPVEVTNTLLIPFRKGDNFGFSDISKKLVIEAKYDDASPFNDGLAEVVINGKRGFIDKAGQEVIPLKYDYVGPFSDGLAKVVTNGKWGFIDKAGQEVISLKYDDVGLLSDGLVGVKLNGKYGFIDKTGQEVIPLKYDDVGSFSEELVKVKLNGKWGFIDKTGQVVSPLKYDNVGSFSDGLAWVALNGKEGFIDKTGQVVIPPKYDNVYWFNEGLAEVELNGKEGFIDKTGQEVIPLKYDNIGSFSEGLAWVKLNGKYGFINKAGQEVISLKYDDVGLFSDGLVGVKLNGKYGFIDKTGQVVIPLKYDDAYAFSNGLAWVTLNGKKFYIDKNGTEYYQP